MGKRIGIFLMALLLMVPAALPAQSGKKVSVNVKNVPLGEFLKQVESQTGFSFAYNNADINLGAPVTVIATNEDADEVLARVLGEMDLAAKGDGNRIYIEKAAAGAGSRGESRRSRIVSGTVRDENSNPVPGAGVFVKGTRNGVITDMQGRYSIQVEEGAVLVASSLGFSDTEIRVGKSSTINIIMSEDRLLLDDVIVVGYGTQARKTLSTAVSKVDGETLVNSPVNTVGDALKGRVSGLRISTANALAGEAPRFMVRGGSSITMGNDPIYIVDGALMDDLGGLNPNDIESIEVLKDAASAGIYGARASNGVILVTTRKGSSSKAPQVVFDIQMGVQTPSSRWPILNARDYLTFIRPAIAEAMANDSVHPATALLTGPNAYGTGNTGGKALFSTRYLEYREPVPEGYTWMYDPLNPNKVITFQDNDWQDQWFSTAFWQKEYVGVNGGSDRMKYAASAGWTKDDGVVAVSGYDVFTMHGNTSFKITSFLEAGATFDLSRQEKQVPVDNYYQAIGRGLIAAPTAMEKNPDGEWNQLVATNNKAHSPAWWQAFYDRSNTRNRASGSFFLRWTIARGLEAYAQYTHFDEQYSGSYKALGEVDGTVNSYQSNRPRTETRTETLRKTFTSHLTWKATLAGSHNLSAMAGYEWMSQQYLYLQGKSTGAVTDDVDVLDAGINFEAKSKDQSQALISYFGRVGYDYKNRYVAAFTFRADGSSKFAPGNRWGIFPAGSAAWIVSEEPFFEKMKPVMNNLKFRLSYGQTGNNGIGLFDTYGSYTASSYGALPTIIPGEMQNTEMQWETTTQLDAGLDMGFAKDRVRIILDVYNKLTDNMLFSIQLPDTSPFSTVKANVGSARFYGFEAEIHTVNIDGRKFRWNSDFTIATNHNLVCSLPDEYMYDEVDIEGNFTGRKAWRIGGYTMSETGYRYGGIAVGEPLGRIYGYKVDHIIQTLEEADKALYDTESFGYRVSDGKRIKGRKDAGDYEWCNMPGSAREGGAEIINSEDMFLLGNVTPVVTGGFGNTFTFGRLSLNVYLDYALGHSIINGMKSHLLKNTMGDCNSMLGSLVYDCWTHEGDTDAKYARYTPNDSDWGNRNWRGVSSFMVERADYLCIRDVTLSYDLPEKWTATAGMKRVTVGVSGNTLHYFTRVTGAVSTETGISSSSGASMYEAVSTSNSDGDTRANMMPNPAKVLFNLKLVF